MTATPATNAANTASLDMSLDQLIKNNKNMRRDRRRQRGRGTNRGRGGFPRVTYGGGGGLMGGPFRNRQMKRGGTYSSYRPNPYGAAAAAVPSKFTTRQALEGVWQHDMFEKVTEILPPLGVKPLGIETGTKLYISNLDYAVSTDDIKELFFEVGDVKRCSIHYDPSGRSKGTAEVVYSRKIDGIAALKRYNNVQLDGKAMKIEFIGSNLVTPNLPTTTTTMAAQSAATLQVTNGVSKRFYEGHDLIQAQSHRPFGMGGGGRGRRGFFGGRSWSYRGRGRGRGGRGRGRGRGRGQGLMSSRPSTIPIKSAADLDAELETYHSDAMQT